MTEHHYCACPVTECDGLATIKEQGRWWCNHCYDWCRPGGRHYHPPHDYEEEQYPMPFNEKEQ